MGNGFQFCDLLLPLKTLCRDDVYMIRTNTRKMIRRNTWKVGIFFFLVFSLGGATRGAAASAALEQIFCD